MVTPIPKRLLIHTVVRSRESAADVWGKKTRVEITVSRVRMEPAVGRTWSTGGDLPEIRARLFADTMNSSTADFMAGDEIIFDGVKYMVKAVHKLYGYSPIPHHVECDLV